MTDLDQLQRQLSAWRRRQTGRTRLPEALWSAARDLARTHGPSLVARTLRLDYYQLRRRVAGTSRLPTASPTFIEVQGEPTSGTGCAESLVELFDGDAARMTLRVRSDAATLVALAESFWKRPR